MGLSCFLFSHRFELVRINNHVAGESILGSHTYIQCSKCKKLCGDRLHYGPSHRCNYLINVEDVQAVGGPGSW